VFIYLFLVYSTTLFFFRNEDCVASNDTVISELEGISKEAVEA
jgi:hypothetical protein